MNKERLIVANRISRQLDAIESINDTMKTINDANYENVSFGFNIFCQTENGQISVSSSTLTDFNLDLSELRNTLIAVVKGQVENKFGELNSRFENDQFDEEKK